MVKTLSIMPALGSKAPDFSLMNPVTNTTFTLQEATSVPGTVIMFICNHCPFVKHINAGLTQIARDYMPRGIQFIAISANDIEAYPDDAPEFMIQTAKAEQYPFPYLFDETQAVAHAYQAACTPDFFVYDNQLALVYRGQFDDSRPGNDIPVTGQSLRDALDALLAGKPVLAEQKPSIGCGIKWKK